MSTGEGCYITIGGSVVTVDGGLLLVLRSTRGWHFDLDGPVTFVTPAGDNLDIPMDRGGERLRTLMGPAGRTVSSCAAFLDGRLELTFEDGARLRVEPHLTRESWVAVGPRGTRIVSLPGGALALSQDSRPAPVVAPARVLVAS